MAVESNTAAKLVHQIFDLQRAVRCVAAAKPARGGHRSGAPGRSALRGGGRIPGHRTGGAARRQRPGPQPAHRRTGGTGLRGPPARPRGRAGAADRALRLRRGETARHRGPAHRHHSWASCRTGARRTSKRRRTPCRNLLSPSGRQPGQRRPDPPPRPKLLRSSPMAAVTSQKSHPPRAGGDDPPPDHGSPHRACWPRSSPPSSAARSSRTPCPRSCPSSRAPRRTSPGSSPRPCWPTPPPPRSGASSRTSSTRSSWSSSAS